MLKIIIYGLLIYFLYKLIFDFIIPVSRATKQIKTKIKQAQQEQERRFQNQQNPHAQAEQQFQKTEAPKDAEYIDYEEVK